MFVDITEFKINAYSPFGLFKNRLWWGGVLQRGHNRLSELKKNGTGYVLSPFGLIMGRLYWSGLLQEWDTILIVVE